MDRSRRVYREADGALVQARRRRTGRAKAHSGQDWCAYFIRSI